MHQTEELPFQAVTPLDLAACRTVNDIVKAMANCAVGARMLGEAADTWERWIIRDDRVPVAIYSEDYEPEAPLGAFLNHMKDSGWIRAISDHYSYIHDDNVPVLAVGAYPEDYSGFDQVSHENIIFINPYGQCSRSHIGEGHYPNSVFADPLLALCILDSILQERISGNKETVSDLMSTLANYDGTAGDTAKGARLLWSMVRDPDCHVTLTMSGAMTPLQMSLVIIEMIKRKMVQAIFSTGALMSHGLIAGCGLKHLKYDPSWSDAELAEKGLNRVTDTLEPETNFVHIGEVLDLVYAEIPDGATLGTWQLHKLIGQHMSRYYGHTPSILGSAFEQDVPVFVPAFIDSEMGNDLVAHNLEKRRSPELMIHVDPMLDSIYRVTEMRRSLKRAGIYEIGGGVPRNHPQNDPVLERILRDRCGTDIKPLMFSEAVRICPDQPWIGHLSGCTFSEGKSWGKFTPDAETAEILSDATLVWPFHVKYVMDKQDELLGRK